MEGPPFNDGLTSRSGNRRNQPLPRRLPWLRSRFVRGVVQALMVALNLWLGVEFWLWVRVFESGGPDLHLTRPPGVEGWLPIAGAMNFRSWLETGQVPAIHPAAMVLFLAFLTMSLVFKKAFCSWFCPIGTLSEKLWRIGRRVFGSEVRLPRWLDLPLRGLKYLLLAFFLFAIASMSAESVDAFMRTPYGLVADVKMLNFFRFIGVKAAIVIALLALASFVIPNAWCRYLCPYGALMGLVSLASPFKIRRDSAACVNCGACARACPAALPVDRLGIVRSAECTACLDCVGACRTPGALFFSSIPVAGRRVALGPVALGALVTAVFCGAVVLAQASGHWRTEVPDSVYRDLIPRADTLSHPGL